MNGLSFRLERRQESGVSLKASYTLAKSTDNTTATSGSPTVAQDDQNLAAEWALSGFDRRHQLSAGSNIELPWGRDRRWLSSNDSWWAPIVSDWSVSANLTWMSGAPMTARCLVCASDVARGTGGTLRANYTGAAIPLSDPTVAAFFNTAAFSIPAAGTYGNALRNVIVGPGSRLLSAQATRDIRFGGSRSVSISVNANNLLNLVNYAGVDTSVDSPTFGQVVAVRPMRTVRLTARFRF
jgi:hypothetical protein